MSVVQNRILSSALGVARHLAITTNRAHIVLANVQRACSTYEKLRTTVHWRSLDCDIRMAHSMTQPTWIMSKDESRELMAIWPDVVRDLTDIIQKWDLPDITKWLAKVLQYNVPGGKKTRSLALVYAYKMLAPNDHVTEENIRLARILAWCVELLHAFFIVIDDFQDQSTFRRDQPCWYKYKDIGRAAINDGLMLESIMYQLLRKHFEGKDYYVELLQTFHEITLITILGQSLDLYATTITKASNLDLFTMDRYNNIVNCKTAYYTFILPITSAMHLAGIKDPEMFRQAKTILSEMGHFYQIQDDYLDCYGKPEVIGKIGTDIEEGKCSWLVVVALQRVTPTQRKILEECYGSSDPEKVKRVKQLYNDLGLPNMYSIYEEETYNLLNTHIQQLSRGLPHNLFLKLLEKIHHRVS